MFTGTFLLFLGKIRVCLWAFVLAFWFIYFYKCPSARHGLNDLYTLGTILCSDLLCFRWEHTNTGQCNPVCEMKVHKVSMSVNRSMWMQVMNMLLCHGKSGEINPPVTMKRGSTYCAGAVIKDTESWVILTVDSDQITMIRWGCPGVGYHRKLKCLLKDSNEQIAVETKWPLFCRRPFQIHFPECKCMDFE